MRAAEKTNAAATFGPPPGTSKPEPSTFVRAHSGEPALPPPGPPSRPKEHVKPPVPGKEEVPLMGLVSAKNYVLANAVENMLAPAKKPPPPPPPATAKPDFGKVPAYLHDVKARLAAEKQAEVDRQAAEAAAAEAASGLRMLSEEERLSLLSQLQDKWKAVHGAYMRLPLVCDTDPKKRRKEAHEQELKQLEADIATLGKAPVWVAIDT